MRIRLAIPGLRWWLLGLGLYLLFLLLRLPAATALAWLPQGTLPPGLQFRHAQGTVWAGTLRDARVAKLALGDLHWRLTPWSLFTGRFGTHVEVDGAIGRASAWIGTGFGGNWRVDDVQGTLQTSAFDPLVRPLMLDGKLLLKGLSAEFEPGVRWQMEGAAVWEQARIGGVQDIALGSVSLTARPRGDGSLVRIENRDGDLAVTGQLTLGKDGSWRLDASLQNRDASRQDLQQMLRFLGRPDSAGRYRLQRAGRLPLP